MLVKGQVASGATIGNVAILLAVYNGEKYIREQLDSLYSQTYKDWSLYIHDDGSIDATMSIIREYIDRYDNIEILPFSGGCGAKDSFLKMLQEIDADYYFFCDQDDVWTPQKVEISLSEIKKIELEFGADKPIIIHSDLEVVDKELRTISKSFWNMMMIRPDKLKTFNQLGANCLVTGCTMLFNSSAKKCTLFPANNALMHDVWITLCVAKHEGVIYGINIPLIKYRQHDKNTLGAKDMRQDSKLINKLCNWKRIISQNRATYNMLKDLNYGSWAKFIFFKILYRL